MSAFMNMIEQPMPSSGPVKIVRDAVKPNWDMTFAVYQYGGGFRMASSGNDGGKVTLAPDDALWIIETLSLGANKDTIFRRAITWRD